MERGVWARYEVEVAALHEQQSLTKAETRVGVTDLLGPRSGRLDQHLDAARDLGCGDCQIAPRARVESPAKDTQQRLAERGMVHRHRREAIVDRERDANAETASQPIRQGHGVLERTIDRNRLGCRQGTDSLDLGLPDRVGRLGGTAIEWPVRHAPVPRRGLELAVASPEELAHLDDGLVHVAPRLTLAHSLFARDIVESFPIKVKAQQRAVAAPSRRILGSRVRRANLLHGAEQHVLQGNTLGGQRRVGDEGSGERVNLEQRRLVQLRERVLCLCQEILPFHTVSPPASLDREPAANSEEGGRGLSHKGFKTASTLRLPSRG
jgi:hypothetical protein